MRIPNPSNAPSPLAPHHSSLTLWHKLGLAAFALVVIAFAYFVERRAAYQIRPMTDVQVYLRAAWAVRHGEDPYTITDDNHWHYHYPLLLAILMQPLADAPPEEDRAGLLPFGVSVGIWYAFSVLCLIFAVHRLASALEERSADPPARGCRRWWALRMLPLLVCLPPIGHTLMRGQVNLLLLALLCGMASEALRGRSWRAGFWLAAAICLKVIPAFLLIYPLWKRDWRWLAAAAAGMAVGAVIVPSLCLGPGRTVELSREWVDVLARPGLGAGEDHARDKELIEATATDSQSILSVLHNNLHPDPLTRPRQVAPILRRIHWLAGGVLTLLTLLAGWWTARREGLTGPNLLILLGLLIEVMLLVSPVCHLHYFCLSLLLVMGLFLRTGERRSGWLAVVLGLYLLSNIVLHLPGLYILRDRGFAGCTALALWLVGCVVLASTRPTQAAVPTVRDLPAAA